MSLTRWPGLIDIHVHFRDPGATHKEDFFTGSRAAVRGGFSFVVDMPNNPTPTVTYSRLLQKIKLADKKAVCEVGFYFGTNGKNIGEFSKAWHHPRVLGLKIYCNHTTGEMLIDDLHLLTKVFSGWKSNKPILVHAEGIQLAAVIGLAKLYSRRLHVCHISQKVEVELVRKAKKTKQLISAGVCPHHLFLTKKDVNKLKNFAVMKPPLGTKGDQRALWEGLKDGTIDLIETDHAPHTIKEKSGRKPAFGVPGLETALGLMLKAVNGGKITLHQVKKWMYHNPKKIFSIPDSKDTFIEFDHKKSYTAGEDGWESKCNWSPFTGYKLFGQIEKMVIGGKVVVDREPFYNPNISYIKNFKRGPFGAFAESRAYKQKGKPKYKFLGHRVHSPFGIPAGPLINSNFVKAAFRKGFDICVYKTVRTREHPCLPAPNVVPVDIKGNLTLKKAAGKLTMGKKYSKSLSITNSFGVPSPNPDWWQADMKKAIKSAKEGQIMIGSFQGTMAGDGNVKAYIHDYVLGAKLVKETGAKILIANLSCPNEGKSDLLCFDVEQTTRIAIAIKDEIGNTPLLLKLAYFEDYKHLESLVRNVGRVVHGLVAINTIPARVVKKSGGQALPGKGRERIGICGRAIQWAGLSMTEQLVSCREKLNMDFMVVGVGGVTTPEDYLAYRKVGADAVMSATGAMWNPHLAQKIKKEL